MFVKVLQGDTQMLQQSPQKQIFRVAASRDIRNMLVCMCVCVCIDHRLYIETDSAGSEILSAEIAVCCTQRIAMPSIKMNCLWALQVK